MNQISINLVQPSAKSNMQTNQDNYQKKDTKESFDSYLNKFNKTSDKKGLAKESTQTLPMKNKLKNIAYAEEEGNKVDAEMLINLMAQQLQLNVEDIQLAVEELGISAIELLDAKNFSEMMSVLYQVSSEELLMSDVPLQDMKELWEAFEKINQAIELGEVELEATHVNTTAIQDNASSLLKTEHAIEEDTMIEGVLATLNQEAADETKVTKYEQADADANVNNEELAISRLGLQIPIETFNNVSEARVWTETNEQIMAKWQQETKLDMQILNRLEMTALKEGTEIQMDLYPKELGKLSVKIVEQNSIFTAQIKVESEKTKELLLQNIDSLKEGLEKQGLMIGSFEVNVNEQSKHSHMQQQKQKSSKRIDEIIMKHLNEIEQEKANEQTILTQSEVDIMA